MAGGRESGKAFLDGIRGLSDHAFARTVSGGKMGENP